MISRDITKMAVKIVMPKMTDTMEEGILIRWYKKEGEKIEAGDRIAEIETDKAVMDLEAYGSGILKRILVSGGMRVPVGRLIGVIAREDEDIEAILAEEEKETKVKIQVEEKKSFDGELVEPEEERWPVKLRKETIEIGRLEISPRARRIAEEAGIDISMVKGSGPGGRITQRDIEAYLSTFKVEVAKGPGYEDKEPSLIRKAIAKRMAESKGPVPHFYLTSSIDMKNILDLKATLEKEGLKVSITDFIVKASAMALKGYPKINASFMENTIRYHKRVNIGIAVALEEGLIVPVIKDADLKGLKEIADEAMGLIQRARVKSLRPDEYEGGSITVSNLGMYDIDNFIAIITPPEAAVLAVGSIADEPAVMDGQIGIARGMKVTLSCDHRIIDGAEGARFLKELKRCLEYPARMIV